MVESHSKTIIVSSPQVNFHWETDTPTSANIEKGLVKLVYKLHCSLHHSLSSNCSLENGMIACCQTEEPYLPLLRK